MKHNVASSLVLINQYRVETKCLSEVKQKELGGEGAAHDYLLFNNGCVSYFSY